ncbi:MAG: hypothetical protein AAF849_12815 [Bacteroidota bacterium]
MTSNQHHIKNGNWLWYQRILEPRFSLLLAAICIGICSIQAQFYPYSLAKLEYKSDALIDQIFKNTDAKFDAESTQAMLFSLDSLFASPSSTSRQKATCLTVSGYLLAERKEREEAFLFYKEALPLVKGLPKNDLVYSVVHGNYGMYMAYYQLHDIALPHLKNALPALSTENEESSFKERGLYEAIIHSYYATEKIDSAILYQEIMIDAAKRQENKLLVSQVYNNAGWSCNNAKRPNKAIQYYNAALEWADTTTAKGLFYYVNALESRAHPFVELGYFEQAISDLKYTYQARRRLEELTHAMQALAYIINYYLKAGEVNRAYQFVQNELSYFDLNAKITRRNAPAYLALAELYESMGEEGAAKPYRNVYNQYLADKFEETDVSKASYNLNAYMSYRNQVHEQGLKLERLEKENLSKELLSTRILLFFLGLISLLVVGLIYTIGKGRISKRQQRLELEQKSNETLQLKNENLQYELRLKEQDIRRIAADNKIRTSLKQKFLQQLKKLSKYKETELKKELRFLIREIEQTIDNQEQLSLLQQKVETINASFEERIRERIEGVSAREIKLCSLIKIGMSNQEIAKLLYKQDSTIRSYKYRLKKKAGLDSVKELERMVMEL